MQNHSFHQEHSSETNLLEPNHNYRSVDYRKKWIKWPFFCFATPSSNDRVNFCLSLLELDLISNIFDHPTTKGFHLPIMNQRVKAIKNICFLCKKTTRNSCQDFYVILGFMIISSLLHLEIWWHFYHTVNIFKNKL